MFNSREEYLRALQDGRSLTTASCPFHLFRLLLDAAKSYFSSFLDRRIDHRIGTDSDEDLLGRLRDLHFTNHDILQCLDKFRSIDYGESFEISVGGFLFEIRNLKVLNLDDLD